MPREAPIMMLLRDGESVSIDLVKPSFSERGGWQRVQSWRRLFEQLRGFDKWHSTGFRVVGMRLGCDAGTT